MQQTNDILFYVHYNKNSDFHSHVIYQLEKLRPIFKRIVLVSNSQLSSEHTARISKSVDEIFQRANTGYDFFAWKEALDREGQARLKEYDSITLMNDTCFGPLFDMGDVYDKMRVSDCNFWGMMNHRRMEKIVPALGTNILEHIQSFFIVFKREVVNSTTWSAFWQTVECEDSVFRVIAKYEVQLTQILCDAGFRYEALLDTRELDLTAEELSYIPADYCINDRIPILKIKALLQHKNPRYIIGEIHRLTSYPVELIEDYMTKEFQPDRSMLYCNKVLDIGPVVSSHRWPSIAIHVHVFYLDVWRRYIEYLQILDFPYSLYVTTNTEEKALEIVTLLEQFPSARREKIQIAIMPNEGRDIVPWIALADRLGEYDLVLHAHTKRSPSVVRWVGASWQQDIFDAVFGQAPQIARAFAENPNIGIVIPDMPRYWRDIAPPHREAEAKFIVLMNELWREMGCEKKIKFGRAPIFVMPYGNMFWYRPAALKKMTSLTFDSQRIPEEPLPDRTILHALERLIVYVAWDAGFDYRIIPSRELATGFHYSMIHNQYIIPPPSVDDVKHQRSLVTRGEIMQDHRVALIRKLSRLRNRISKIMTWALPRWLLKMITPYGLVRLHQKNAQHGHSNAKHFQNIGEYWLRAHRQLQPMNIVRNSHEVRHLNLVISSLRRTQLFGGIATCTVIASILSKELGLPLRIITRDGGATLAQYREIMAVMGIEPCTEVTFYSDHLRDEIGQGCGRVYCSNSDIFLASSWWTATVLRQCIDKENVYHIIQEDELMFYMAGDDYLNCRSALNSADSKYIVNSSFLHSWFKEAHPQIYRNSVVFEPVFRRDMDRTFPVKRTFNLFFYARRSNPRNLFWFGMQIIDSCFMKGILDPMEWNIYLAGDDSIPPVKFYGDKVTNNLGILGWEEYRTFLKDVDLGLCLIHTPHPGYPVYDVASCGGVAVTNTLYTKQAFPCSENIIACDLTIDAFMDGMKKAATLAKDSDARRRNYIRQDLPYSWTESLADVVKFFKQDIGSGVFSFRKEVKQ